MKKFWAVPVITGILIFAACNMENKASEYGLYPDDFYGKINTIMGLNGTVGGSKPFIVHACCDQRPPQDNNGPAEWAVDGDTSHWWYTSSVPSPEGYSVDTRTTGHVGDNDNYLMRGSDTIYDGYTWTRDAFQAMGGPEDPLPIGDIVPFNGSHWITLDFGEEVEIGPGKTGIIGYYRRADSDSGGLGSSGTTYEIYASKWDFGWIVEEEPGIVRLSTGTVANAAGYVYIYITPESAVKFRYLQLRWRYTGSSKIASAANIIFRTIGTEPNYDYLLAVHILGREVLRTIPPSNREYYRLQTELNRALPMLPLPDEIAATLTTPQLLFVRQTAINNQADAILTIIYRIYPPKKPPEVNL